MLGAIAGDIIGSVYEGKRQWLERRHPAFEPLFAPKARFTDDTVLTCAVADSILSGGDLTTLLKEYYARYPGAGFGGDFRRWAESDDPRPYGSWGNGSAMRVSPVAWAYDSLDEVVIRARDSAAVTHNHPEGVRGAKAVAAAVFLARTGSSKWDIRAEVERRFGYDLSMTVEDLRPTFAFDSSCAGTVPPALAAFLDSTDYESAVRLAVSLGGDCDTLACVVGAVAGAFYGVPGAIREAALDRLDGPLAAVVSAFEARFPEAARESPAGSQARPDSRF